MTQGERFIAELLDAVKDPVSRAALALRLRRYAGQTIYLPTQSDRARRRETAHKLLREMDRAEAVAVLMERFGVSERTARRDTFSEKVAVSRGSMNLP